MQVSVVYRAFNCLGELNNLAVTSGHLRTTCQADLVCVTSGYVRHKWREVHLKNDFKAASKTRSEVNFTNMEITSR